MATNNRNYISPAMLPLEPIAEYMEKVVGFRRKNEAAQDTLNVAEVSSDVIAVAAVDTKGNLIEDRNTVKNALSLGGVPASEYVTSEGANALLSDTYQVSVNSGNEIKNLRDELYQLKGELAKAGLIQNGPCYNGFVDAFKVGKEKYIKDAVTVTSTDMSQVQLGYLIVEDTAEFTAGEYICINTASPQIVQIQEVAGEDRINLVSNAKGPIPKETTITKAYGIYNEGMFVFGKKKDVSISPQEKYIILNDDAQPLLLTKKYTPNSGYAAQINIPSTARGLIKKVGVQAKVTGFPGGLRCYIIDNTNNSEDVFTMTTIEEMREKGKIIGESNLLYPSQATQTFNELYFEFPELVMAEKSNYTFLFVQIDADQNNYWELRGLKGETSMDLQTNSKLYSFSEGSILKAEDGDLYLVVVTSDVLFNKIEYAKQGLYTAKVELSNLTPATRVRVELKINREGRFSVVENPNTLVPGVNNPLNTFNEDNISYPTSIFNVGQQIAIGNQIATVGNFRTDNTSYSLTESTYAPAGAPVYRIGYKVQAKAKVKQFDKLNPMNPIKTTKTVLTELPLVAIIPGKESGREDISSDRLIFEAEIKVDEDTGYVLEQFNEIEAQIFWENQGATVVDLNNSPELAGKILDVVVSTDSTYNKIK